MFFPRFALNYIKISLGRMAGMIQPPHEMDPSMVMHVIKRNGVREEISFDKITKRIKSLAADLKVDPTRVSQKVIENLSDGITTKELDDVSASVAAHMALEHPDYSDLAGRIAVSNHQKNTDKSFYKTMKTLYEATDINDQHSPIISKELWDVTKKHKKEIEDAIDYERDFLYDYFGFQTLTRAYLLRYRGKIMERVQHMWMRVALGIHGIDIESALESYHMMSSKLFTHATPTLYNAGTPRPQLSSCFEENTIVTTVNRGPIKIKEVIVGDLVTTHLGNIKKVVQLHQNALGNRKLFNLGVHKSAPLKVTDNHKMWAMKKIGRKMEAPKWMAVDELNLGDAIAIPNKHGGSQYQIDLYDYQSQIIFSSSNRKNVSIEIFPQDTTLQLRSKWNHNNLNGGQDIVCGRDLSEISRYWEVDSDFCRLIGVFFGNGNIIAGKDSAGISYTRGISFTNPSNCPAMISFLQEYGSKLFGISASTHHMKNQACSQVQFHSCGIGIVFEHLFGKGFAGKKVHSSFFSWSRTQVESFIAGLLSTDGCISKDGLCTINLTNVSLCREIYYLARQSGIDVSFGKAKRAKGGTADHVQFNIPRSTAILSQVLKSYNGRIDQFKNIPHRDCQVVTFQDQKFLRIKTKTEIIENLPEFVYTLGIEDDHSYNVAGLSCENCFLLCCEDSIDGICKAMTQCANISKWAGGIGMHIHDVRCKGSTIYGTNGVSNGLVPLLKCFNSLSRFVDQCLGPERTLIWTSDGLKCASQIQVNDKILSDTGYYVPVRQVLEHKYSGDMICAKLNNGAVLHCTPQQQVKSNSSYCDASELSADSKLESVASLHIQDIKQWSISDCKILGMLLRMKQDNGFKIVCQNNQEVVDVIEYLCEKQIQYSRFVNDDSRAVISWEPTCMFPFTTTMLKDTIPRSALHLPIEKCRKIMDGLGEHNHPQKDYQYISSRFDSLISTVQVEDIRIEHFEGFVYDFVLQEDDDHIKGFMTSAGLVHHAVAD